MPLAALLNERYAIATAGVACPYQDRLAAACDEHVVFAVHSDAVLREDGHGAVVGSLAHADERMREVAEAIGVCRGVGESWDVKAGLVGSCTGAAIGDTDAFGGRA